MAHRVNFLLDNTVWEALQHIPKGERSKVANQALSQYLQAAKRKDASRRMDEFRGKLSKVKTGEMERWIRKDRERR